MMATGPQTDHIYENAIKALDANWDQQLLESNKTKLDKYNFGVD
jgi:hypothetical protein